MVTTEPGLALSNMTRSCAAVTAYTAAGLAGAALQTTSAPAQMRVLNVNG
jgi:hypothetical protein